MLGASKGERTRPRGAELGERQRRMKLTKIGDLDVRIMGGSDSSAGVVGPLVVLLHGFGAPGDDLVPLGRVLAAPEGTRFVFPEGAIDLGRRYAGGRAWWPIDFEERMRRQAAGEKRDIAEVPEGLEAARARVEVMLAEAVRILRPPPGKIVLGGFSQGAMLALDVALHSSAALAGLVLMSVTHIAAREWAPRFEGRRGMPVFMSHGQADDLLPFATSESLRDTLAAHGLPVDWVAFRGGHAIPPPVLDGVGTFLRRVLGSSGP
jgi:phospholipase/carboxylesterase